MEKRETVCTLEANDEQKPTRNSPPTQIESGNNGSQRIIRHIIPIAWLVYNMYIYLHTPLYIAVDNRCTVGFLIGSNLSSGYIVITQKRKRASRKPQKQCFSRLKMQRIKVRRRTPCMLKATKFLCT